MTCIRPVDAGAYVLGALAPADRASYERHLATCAECRDEVADLAVLPGLLSRLDAETAVALAQPAEPAPRSILTRTLAAASASQVRERRRHRWALAGTGLAAACLAVLLGLGATTVFNSGSRPPAQPVLAQMTPSRPNGGIVALVGYTPAAGHGTNIKLLCLYEQSSSYGKAWTVDLVLYQRGKSDPIFVVSWQVGGPAYDDSTAKTFTKWTPVNPGDIERLVLTRDDDGAPLLEYRPA
jgi:hypothetical protein